MTERNSFVAGRTSIASRLTRENSTEGSPPGVIRYQIGEEVARGGMGAVFTANDVDLNRKVAMKTVLPELSKDDIHLKRFLTEARAAAALEHPSIVPVHDLGLADDGQPYLTMRLVEGEHLGKVIERLASGDQKTHENFSFIRRLEIIRSVCEALHYAHERGVLHRDVKPENILIGQYGEVFLIDWGLAKQDEDQEVEGGSREPRSDGLTEAGSIVGTLGLMPPEQLRGEKVDRRADIYALGAMMYHLLALQPAHSLEGDTPKVLQRLLTTDPSPADAELRKDQGRVPRQVATIIEKAMQREKEERFETCAEMARAISRYLDGAAPSTCVVSFTSNRLQGLEKAFNNRPYLFIVLGLLLLMIPIVEFILILMLW